MFQCLLVYSLRELGQNLYPTVVWNYKNLNYVELVHGAFQVYNILLLFCIFIVIFWVLYWNLNLKNLNLSTEKNSGTICNFVLYFLLLLLLLSRFSRVQLCVTPETAAHQAPPSLGFSRQEYWSGLPFPSPMHKSEKWKRSRSVVSDSSRLHGLQPTRLLRPWDFPGKSTGVGCYCLLHQ